MIKVLLYFHIFCGCLALFSSLMAILTRKGHRTHRRFGRLFFYAMTGVFLTALPLAQMTRNVFLFLIAIFSYYLAFSGWRFAKNRTAVASAVDLTGIFIMFCVSVLMIGSGLLDYKATETKPLVLIIFGSIGFFLSFTDWRDYRKGKLVGVERILHHSGAMLGATIAALTAFSVTNIPIRPSIILWIGPTCVFIPVIIWWRRKILSNVLK